MLPQDGHFAFTFGVPTGILTANILEQSVHSCTFCSGSSVDVLSCETTCDSSLSSSTKFFGSETPLLCNAVLLVEEEVAVFSSSVFDTS